MKLWSITERQLETDSDKKRELKRELNKLYDYLNILWKDKK
jgi:hypothetical protein